MTEEKCDLRASRLPRSSIYILQSSKVGGNAKTINSEDSRVVTSLNTGSSFQFFSSGDQTGTSVLTALC